MRTIHITLVVIFVVAIFVFSLQNIQTATVAFLGLNASAPLAVVVLAVHLLGMVSGGSVISFLQRSIRAARSTE